MKKLLILALSFFWAFQATAQDRLSADQFEEQLQEILIKQSNLVKDKDYAQAEKTSHEALALFAKLSPEDLEEFLSIKPMLTYDLSCIYALQKKKKLALDAFEMAVKEGYQNYSHALVDSDLDLLRKEKRFLTMMDTLQKRGDYVFMLKTDHAYQKEDTTAMPQFTYEAADSRNLKTLKNHFKLDSIAGDGDEISQILNLLEWVHNAIRHNGSNWALCEFTAIDFYNYYKATGKGVNCRALAMSLNECYLAMGFASKYVTCLPKNAKDPDCHVINTVYSKTLQKWIWVDPTFNAYLKDENGTLLSIAEVRQRLIDNQPIILNDDANWNNEKPQTKEGYIDGYMAKNLYWIEAPEKSVFNSESRYRRTNTKFVALFPLGYTREDIMKYATITHDPEYFWQAPNKNK